MKGVAQDNYPMATTKATTTMALVVRTLACSFVRSFVCPSDCVPCSLRSGSAQARPSASAYARSAREAPCVIGLRRGSVGFVKTSIISTSANHNRPSEQASDHLLVLAKNNKRTKERKGKSTLSLMTIRSLAIDPCLEWKRVSNVRSFVRSLESGRSFHHLGDVAACPLSSNGDSSSP